MASTLEDVVIVGVGETALGKLPGRTPVDLQAEAVSHALHDAGIERARLDGLLNLDPYMVPESMFALTVAEYLGLRLKLVQTLDVGGTVTVMQMLQTAAWAIATGECSTVVCTSGETVYSGRKQGSHSAQMENHMAGYEWEEPVGVRGMVIPYALLAQHYFDTYGDASEALAAIAITFRQHALLHEQASMRKPLDREHYFASQMISTPLRLYDCSLLSDGAGAVLLTNRQVAEQLKLQKPFIRMTGLAVEFTHASTIRMPDIHELGIRKAGERALAQAHLQLADIDVAEIHDAFTISVLIALEALGFCPEGQGQRYILDEGIGLNSRCPINTHGGLLSHAHIGGITHVIEAIRQLRGEAGTRQVHNAKRALVSGNGGIFSVCGAMTLERQER